MKRIVAGLIIFAMVLLILMQQRVYTVLKTDLRNDSVSDNVDTYTICTYFEPNNLSPESDHENREMLEVWKESWKAQGWNTLVLTEFHAKLHPRYIEFKDAVAKLPTVYPLSLSKASYFRWPAAVSSGCKVCESDLRFKESIHILMFIFYCQWMSDFDMVNYGLPPQDNWKGKKIFSFEGSTPSLVTGSKAAFDAVVDAILEVAEDPSNPAISEYRGVKHTSDRDILALRPDLISNIRHPARLDRLESKLQVVTHFARKDVIAYTADLTMTKAQLARNLRPFQIIS